MRITKHAQTRMAQRGINRSLIDFVLAVGEHDNDKYFIDKKQALTLHQIIKKILDKDGVVVVAEGEAVVTAYNRQSRHR